MSGADWAKALNRLEIGRDDLPITIQGGEPTLHKEFLELINGVHEGVKLDFADQYDMPDVDAFIAHRVLF